MMVPSFDDLVLIFVPFFDIYKIVRVKLPGYLYFKKVAELIETKDYLTTLGLEIFQKIKEDIKGR